MPELTLKRILKAAASPDWGQVVANGGPPCFHLEKSGFCLRAERWPGHGVAHDFQSLHDLLRALKQPKLTKSINYLRTLWFSLPVPEAEETLAEFLDVVRALGIEVSE